jgi:hypothetical protein
MCRGGLGSGTGLVVLASFRWGGRPMRGSEALDLTDVVRRADPTATGRDFPHGVASTDQRGGSLLG